jgi:hypothetical protein
MMEFHFQFKLVMRNTDLLVNSEFVLHVKHPDSM